jgi:hypothetical protein
MFQASTALLEKKFLLISSLAACCFKFKGSSLWSMDARVVDPYSFFTDPDPDPVDPDGGQYGSGYGSGSGSNPDPGL